MRLLTIIASFAASAVAAMAVLVLFGWIDSGSLSLDRIGYVAPLFADGAVRGASMALPIAIPTILFTEISRLHSPVVFVIAGIATGLALIAFVSNYPIAEMATFPPYVVRDLLVIMAVSITASLTYWLFAWKLFPPKSLGKKERVVAP
ncbi:MAG: hypothetical protein AAF251_04880 [Pseudomonadota bacterium]